MNVDTQRDPDGYFDHLMTTKRPIRRARRVTPDQIKLRFTKADVLASKDYGDPKHCLLATTLTRRGYKRVAVGSFGTAHIAGATYSPDPKTSFDGAKVLADYMTHEANPPTLGDGYNPDVVGMRVTLNRLGV